ncbi:MAG: 4Fe-4S dicluster domain-containing protein [Desulfovibrio sp.]|jgi:molybdopterin-containing oxidoreductase family iron-sulfur binding subunit|nr:4Fe-4S dicluster domain-containing protein [Desulfovibrio sp.]
MNKSRRSFLKVAGLSVFALTGGLAARAAMPGAAGAGIAPGGYAKGEKALRAGRWAMVIDTRKFAGPEDYEPLAEACRAAHNVPRIPDAQNVKWFWADSYEHCFPDDMNAYPDDKTRARAYPLLCNHCANPPCVRVCPTQATYKTEDGIVAMDYHRCIGCRFCMAGCPYGARSFNFKDPRKFLPSPPPNPDFPTRMIGVVEKCTFCAERLAAGKMPACVEASDGRVLFGDLEDAGSNVRRALAADFSIRRKPSLGTQPGVYYLI